MEHDQLHLSSLKSLMESFDTMRIIDISNNVKVSEHCRPGGANILSDYVWDGAFLKHVAASKEPVFKIESYGGVLFFEMALVFGADGKKYAADYIKEVSKNLFFGGVKYKNGKNLMSALEAVDTLAVVDELTGLYNRRYLKRRLPADILKSGNKKRPMSVVFLDLDHFKEINDTYGHDAGDHILRGVARVLRSDIREKTDWATRYGGDEFIVVLNGDDNRDAKAAAGRIRCDIKRKVFHYKDIPITLTASLGVYTISDFSTPQFTDELIARADKKLYEAKRLGGDTVA